MGFSSVNGSLMKPENKSVSVCVYVCVEGAESEKERDENTDDRFVDYCGNSRIIEKSSPLKEKREGGKTRQKNIWNAIAGRESSCPKFVQSITICLAHSMALERTC